MLNGLYEFKESLYREGIFFCFSGPVSQNLVSEILAILEQKMSLEEVSKSTILRVFSVVVEKAQNIIHYSAEKYIDTPPLEERERERELSFGILAVGYHNDHYFVVCGNLIENQKVDQLKEKLTRLQGMDKEELKRYYREQRKKNPAIDSKGAGLGFIDMAKKSSKPIEFAFKPIDEKLSFFSLKTVI